MNSISSEEELKKLPRPVRKGAKRAPKMMHFGPGAFFRSFVASLIDKVNQYDIEKWGIVAVSLNSESTFDKLEDQDFVFNALSISSDKNQIQQVSSISNIFVAKKDRQSVLAALSDEKIKIAEERISELNTLIKHWRLQNTTISPRVNR